MANKKSGEQTATSEKSKISPTDTSGELENFSSLNPAIGQQDEQLTRQTTELKDLVTLLMAAIQDSQVRSAQKAEFKNTVDEIKHLAKVIPTATGYGVIPQKPVSDKNDCDDCGCIGSDCCCFEIVLDKVRAIQPQGILEIADSGDTTLPIPTINELEVRLFAAIDNVGILIPSLSTTMGLRVPSFLSGGGPGLWMPLDRVIGRVFLKKGTLKTLIVDFQASEVDEGIERPLGFKDEHGAASGSITLDCCTSKIYPSMPTDLSFSFGGSGGGNPGAISLAFYARRVCC